MFAEKLEFIGTIYTSRNKLVLLRVHAMIISKFDGFYKYF